MNNILFEHFKNPPKKYRPIPFWSWNEKLNIDETRRQIAEMDKAGIGGYFMHARGGLQSEYMGQEWMENIDAGIDEGRKRGMGAWAYDENGWPSGFGDGKVNGRGEAYQQKYLMYEIIDVEKKREDGRTITNASLKDGRIIHFYYDVNPFYVDTLDALVIKTFLEDIYQPYYDNFKNDFGEAMPGFFTDEPQVSRNGIPWSLTLPDKYNKCYNEDLLSVLPHLFFNEEGSSRTRYRFWHLIQELFVTNFTEQIYNWCTEHGSKLTGHMVMEENLLSQITTNGAVMPHYEFFHVPGMDWLGRYINPPTTPLQVSSVAHQLGKKQILSETFALTGWNISFEELKWIYEWQMVRGITLLCQHLEGYSLRGIRKRDYPPSLFYQQPWWDKYRVFNDAVSRIGMLLSEGEADFEVLVIHPQSSAWLHFNNRDNTQINMLQQQLLDITATLENNHIPFHYGDERIIKRHGKVNGDSLEIGEMSYSVIIMPPMDTLSSSVLSLLQNYVDNGGIIIWVGQKPSLVDGDENSLLDSFISQGHSIQSVKEIISVLPKDILKVSIADNSGSEIAPITMTSRSMPGGTYGKPFRLFYLVNSDRENSYKATIRLPGAVVWVFDIMDGTVKEMEYKSSDDQVIVKHRIEPMGSLVLFVSDTEDIFNSIETFRSHSQGKPLETEKLSGDWEMIVSSPNVLTLDYCDFWFDGELQAENEHVSVIQERACKLERPVNIRMRYEVNISQGYIPNGELFLVIEMPEMYNIKINGRHIPNRDCGYYRDQSFRKIDIAGCLQEGKNELLIETDFKQSLEVYEQLSKARVFESEKNKLTYDNEIEAVYIIGDFGVSTPGTFTPLPRKAVRYCGDFFISELPTKARMGDLIPQGLPFFSGKVSLKKTFILKEDEIHNRSFALKENMATLVELIVNGKPVTEWYWRPFEVDLSEYLHAGENTIELQLTGTLRNTLGPHHLEEGESYTVTPASFLKEPGIWGSWTSSSWNDSYHFTEFGVIL